MLFQEGRVVSLDIKLEISNQLSFLTDEFVVTEAIVYKSTSQIHLLTTTNGWVVVDMDAATTERMLKIDVPKSLIKSIKIESTRYILEATAPTDYTFKNTMFASFKLKIRKSIRF